MGLKINKLVGGRVEIFDEEGDKVFILKGSQIETINSAIGNLVGEVNKLEKEIKDLKYRVDKLED